MYSRRQPFESFNARALTPSEVAETFVPPPCFLSLVGRKHSVLVGPRGSGKTTLLKMLHPAAIHAWGHAEAERVRRRISYTGVFVPFDRSWKEQLGALGRNLSEDEQEALGIAAFTTHVLRSFVSSLQYVLSHGSVFDEKGKSIDSITREQEVEFCQSIASRWYLSLEVPSLNGLLLALTDRLTFISEFGSKISLLKDEDRRLALVNTQFLHLQFLTALLSGIERVESVLNVDLGHWALLFDELELAPPAVFDLLVRSLRSTESRFIFKLSLSPYTPDYEMTIESAMPGDDYDLLTLSYPNKEDSYRFCREIVQQIIVGRDLEQRTVEEVFGRSLFEGEVESNSMKPKSGYKKGSGVQKRFRDLAKRDPSFREYLEDHDINLDRIDKLSESQRATIRKFVSVVTVRDEYLGDVTASGKSRIRSRKNPTLYSGATVLFDVSEGNPRLLIGLVERLLDARQPGGTVRRNRQSAEIRASVGRYRAYLKTIPMPEADFSSSTTYAPHRGLLSLLDAIGRHFFKQICGQEFRAEPALSFIVDSTVTEHLEKALSYAMNAGAIVEVSQRGSATVSGNLRGSRFRLAYLLATEYKLPLHLGRHHSLKEILESSGAQQELF